MFKKIFYLTAIAFLHSISQFASAQYSPEVGKLHPDFKLRNIHDGKPHQLSDYRGTKVLLIHFASW